MDNINGLLEHLKQHEKLVIQVRTQDSPDLPDEVVEKIVRPHRTPYYFFIFVERGQSVHRVDLEEQVARSGQLLFVLPDQIHAPVPKEKGTAYFKLSFDRDCLSFLPQSYPFLVNPLVSQVISFDPASGQRVGQLFRTLGQLLQPAGNSQEAVIILAHLNALMTELNSAYFQPQLSTHALSGGIRTYIAFKTLIEAQFTRQPSVAEVAAQLSLSTSRLYNLVKGFAGVSPKEFLINRLILEAQRRLYYTDISTKELAYELGFNDPDYFSRLFRKHTGKNVTEFLAEIGDLSGN